MGRLLGRRRGCCDVTVGGRKQGLSDPSHVSPHKTRCVEAHNLLKYKVGLNLLYPKIGEIRSVYNAAARGSVGRVQRNCVYCLVLPALNRKNMGIRIHVRGTTKWGRRDCVTAHGLRTDYQQ